MIYDRKSNFEMQYCKNVVNFLLSLYTRFLEISSIVLIVN